MQSFLRSSLFSFDHLTVLCLTMALHCDFATEKAKAMTFQQQQQQIQSSTVWIMEEDEYDINDGKQERGGCCVEEESASKSSLVMIALDEDNSEHSGCCQAMTNKKGRSIRSKVRFCLEETKIIFVPSRSQLPIEEINETWFNADDYLSTRLEVELTESAMTCENNRYQVDDEVLCSRGLSDTDSLLARAECNEFIQKLVLNQIAFLQQQQQQQQQGGEGVVVDFSAVVAKVYADCSAPAVQQAHQLALRDAADALEYLTSPS